MGSTRRPESHGLANLVLLCEDPCHRRVESHRTEALDFGWLVPQHKVPAEVPIFTRGFVLWLHDDGTSTQDAPCDGTSTEDLIIEHVEHGAS